MIGMMIDRKLLLKFFLCYETFFFTISVVMLLYSCEINELIIVFLLIWLSFSSCASAVDSIWHFSLFFGFAAPFFLFFINRLDRIEPLFYCFCSMCWLTSLGLSLIIPLSFNYSFDSSSSFFIPPFQYLLLCGSAFFFKAPIHCIEVFNGVSSCYSLYHIHYFSSLQLALFFFLVFVLVWIV